MPLAAQNCGFLSYNRKLALDCSCDVINKNDKTRVRFLAKYESVNRDKRTTHYYSVYIALTLTNASIVKQIGDDTFIGINQIGCVFLSNFAFVTILLLSLRTFSPISLSLYLVCQCVHL